jgi:hypothetical protein
LRSAGPSTILPAIAVTALEEAKIGDAMFRWLRKKAESKIVQSHLSAMLPWLRQLSTLSDEGVAAVYLSALYIRNITRRSTGIDLMNPDEALGKNKMLAVHLGGQVREAQKSSLYNSANGFKVWVFTIRSVMHAELRPIGLEIWRQLSRGLPHVYGLAKEVSDRTGYENDLTGLGQVPAGFEAAVDERR